MSVVSKWTTYEILDFLNSYHLNQNNEAYGVDCKALSEILLKELNKRSRLLALPYTLNRRDI